MEQLFREIETLKSENKKLKAQKIDKLPAASASNISNQKSKTIEYFTDTDSDEIHTKVFDDTDWILKESKKANGARKEKRNRLQK